MNMFVSTAAIAAVPTAPPAMPAKDSSAVASLMRAEEVVELLRTCYIREGWKIDEERADRALAYCRKYAEDGSDPDEERVAAFDFFASHGQSLDWIFDGDHRSLICRLASYSSRANSCADAELVSLADQLVSAAAESRRLNSIVDAMDGERWDVPPPAALNVRAEDEQLGIPEPINDRGDRIDSYTVGVSRLCHEKWAVASKTDHDDGGYSVTVRQFTPSPEARRRADEIVAAFDQWEAAKDKKPRGYKTAKRAYEKAERIESRLEQKIHSISATTIAGMNAKARCAELYYFEGGIYGDFGESIARDLLELNQQA